MFDTTLSPLQYTLNAQHHTTHQKNREIGLTSRRGKIGIMQVDRIFLIQDAEDKDQSRYFYLRQPEDINGEMKDAMSQVDDALPSTSSCTAVVEASPTGSSWCKGGAYYHHNGGGGTSSASSSSVPHTEELGMSINSIRSASIPLPSSHIDRTQSEIQFDMDQAAAQQREISMFYRVVHGREMKKRCQQQQEQEQQLCQQQQQQQSSAGYRAPQESQTISDYPVKMVSQDLLPALIHRHHSDCCDGNHPCAGQAHPRKEQVAYPTIEDDDHSEDWSITGYDSVYYPPPTSRRQQLHYLQDDDDDDDNCHDVQGIFDLDL